MSNMTSNPRPSRFEKIFNDVLVAANGCLAVVAILLACLIVIELQIMSAQNGDAALPLNGDMTISPM